MLAAFGAPFPVAGRPDGQQAGEDPLAGQLGGGGQDGGGDVRGDQGLGHRADSLAAAGVCGWRPGSAAAMAWCPWMRTSWVAVIQAHISWMTWCGVCERRIGPREGPASVIADLSSPITVSTAAHRSG